jgi:hypothetical protein
VIHLPIFVCMCVSMLQFQHLTLDLFLSLILSRQKAAAKSLCLLFFHWQLIMFLPMFLCISTAK